MGKLKLYLVGSSNEPNQFNDNDIVTLGFKNINELTKL